LIVEDSDVQAQMYNIIFARYTHKFGTNLIFAANGREAIQAIAQNADLDLIISDINMPEMDGMQFLTILKNSKLVSCPIIIISTADNLDKLKSAKLSGLAQEFVVKPWNMKDLQLLIERLTEIR
jgi:sigma-B regulation protein RsbU (phosphoserine phosphatase)